MSGHSKWSTIKRQKQANDQARGKVFTKLANAITLSVREGGGIADPLTNVKLRFAVDKAKAANMPRINIERAIDRAMGKGDDHQLEEVLYEGFGPLGIAVLAEGVTDNKQRTVASVRNIFATHGGNLGQSGSVVYLFTKAGEMRVRKTLPVDTIFDIIATHGALDLEEIEDAFIITTPADKMHEIRIAIEKANGIVEESELIYSPTSEVFISDKENSEKILGFLQALDDVDDIHKIHTNAKIQSP